MWLLIKHNFYNIEKNKRLHDDARRYGGKRCIHMQNRKPAAISHIFMSTLYHKRKRIQE